MALKALNTLIRLHKRRVDVIRREMVALEEERRQLLIVAQNLRADYEREITLSAKDPALSGFFGAYSARVKARQAAITQEIKRVDAAIEQKAAAIREEFGEQKKYEIAAQHAKKKLATAEAHRQQGRFDEIAAQQYRKSGESSL